MGTRGVLGIKKRGEIKCNYNHYDSYFKGGLGEDIVKTLNNIPKETRGKELSEVFDNIVLLNEEDIPTDEIIEYCKKWNVCDFSVSSRSEKDYYCLLRNTQGNLDIYLKGFKYMLDDRNFLNDNLFCEYGYIINLDENTLDIYRFGHLDTQYSLFELDNIRYEE